MRARLTIFLLGCSEDSRGGAARAAGEVAIFLREENDILTHEGPILQAVPARADSRVDWSGLVGDLGGGREPHVGTIYLLKFGALAPAEVQERLCAGILTQSDLDGFVAYDPAPGDTIAWLSEFRVDDNPLDPAEDLVEDEDGSYLLLVTRFGSEDLFAPLAMAFIEPREGASEAVIALDAGVAAPVVSADLAAGEPLSRPEGTEILVIWSYVPLSSAVEALTLARYDGDPAALAEDLGSLEEGAEEYYTAAVAGAEGYHLSELAAQGFSGLGDEGTWLLALGGGACAASPALSLYRFE